MELAQGMDRRAGSALLWPAIALAGALILLVPKGFARDHGHPADATDGGLASFPSRRPALANTPNGADRTQLLPSLSLEKQRKNAHRPVTGKAGPPPGHPAPDAEAPLLRLQETLVTGLPAPEARHNPGLPAGELSRAGIAPASRLRIRDGAIYLEGDGTVHRGDAQGTGIASGAAFSR